MSAPESKRESKRESWGGEYSLLSSIHVPDHIKTRMTNRLATFDNPSPTPSITIHDPRQNRMLTTSNQVLMFISSCRSLPDPGCRVLWWTMEKATPKFNAMIAKEKYSQIDK